MANNTNKFLTITNILLNFYNIKFMKIVLNKIFSKFFETKNVKSINWAKEMSIGSTKEFTETIDKEFYISLKENEVNKIESNIQNILPKLPKILRFAAANYELLYFLIRKFRPLNILETGVAIGYSSCFILAGIKRNSYGKLFSSDFHFLGVSNSKKYIGFLPKELNYDKNWKLLTEGDEFNIPKFLNLIGENKIDLFHYDSEKSYRGKKNTMNLINNNTTDDTIYIFDDIQDDFFFRDFVKKKNIKFVIVEVEQKNKFCGIAGNFLKKYF